MQMAAFAQKLTLSDGKLLEEIAEHFIYPCNLEELSIPVYIAALDMVSGKGVFIHKGNARKAAQAALSIAGYFPGIPLDGMELYDAQGVFPVPIQAMQFADVDVIIASCVDKNLMPQFQAANVVDLLFRQNEIAYYHVLGEVNNCSDVVIQPDLEDIHWTDFRKMETIVKLGFKAAQAALPDILDILNGKRKVAPVQERAWHQWRMQDKEQFIITGFEPIKK
jgi:NTE family protein